MYVDLWVEFQGTEAGDASLYHRFYVKIINPCDTTGMLIGAEIPPLILFNWYDDLTTAKIVTFEDR